MLGRVVVIITSVLLMDIIIRKIQGKGSRRDSRFQSTDASIRNDDGQAITLQKAAPGREMFVLHHGEHQDRLNFGQKLAPPAQRVNSGSFS